MCPRLENDNGIGIGEGPHVDTGALAMTGLNLVFPGSCQLMVLPVSLSTMLVLTAINRQFCQRPQTMIMTFSVWSSNIWLTSSPSHHWLSHLAFLPSFPPPVCLGSLQSRWCYLWNKLWIIVLCPRVRGNLFKPSIQDELARIPKLQCLASVAQLKCTITHEACAGILFF